MFRFLFFVPSLLLLSIPAYADTPLGPYSYAKLTESTEYVLIMHSGKDSALKEEYPAAGLYKLGGAKLPVWTIDWYAFNVLPSSDGQHLVRFGPWASHKQQLAIAFYKNGVELHQYLISDLVDDFSKMQYSVSHFRWRKSIVWNEQSKTITLATLDNIAYTFSITTGEIIRAERFNKRKFSSAKNAVKKFQRRSLKSNLSDDATNELLDIVDKHWQVIGSFNSALLSDEVLAEKVIGVHGITYENFDAPIRDRRDLAMLAMTSGRETQKAYLGRHSDDPEILIASVRHNGEKYGSLPENLKDDKTLLLEALHNAGFTIYSDAPSHLQIDRDVVIRALKAQVRLVTEMDSWSQRRAWDFNEITAIPAMLLEDAEVVESLDRLISLRAKLFRIDDFDDLRNSIYSAIRSK